MVVTSQKKKIITNTFLIINRYTRIKYTVKLIVENHNN